MIAKSREPSHRRLSTSLFLSMVSVATTFGQGRVDFNIHSVNAVITKVYLPSPADPGLMQIGNGPSDFPPGTTDWTGWTPVSGSAFTAQLFAANGADVPIDSLAPAFPTTTFLTGKGAGFVNDVVTTFNNVPYGAMATVQMRVWDNQGGTIPDWAKALAQPRGTEILGMSVPINISLSPPSAPPQSLYGLRSFNLTYNVPEPCPFALFGLGAFLLWFARTRNGGNGRSGTRALAHSRRFRLCAADSRRWWRPPQRAGKR
jgi:hypothetical protein